MYFDRTYINSYKLIDNTNINSSIYSTPYWSFYKVYLFTHTNLLFKNAITFQSTHSTLFISLNETSLLFFNITNRTILNINCLTIYIIHPLVVINYIHKIQCFCFNYLLINSLETIELPVLLYFSNTTIGMLDIHSIFMYYSVLCNSLNYELYIQKAFF